MTKRSLAVAAALKKASGGNPVFVFASRADALPEDEKSAAKMLSSASYSKFSCKSCSTEMHALSKTDPFCITCGSPADSVEADAKVGVTAKSDLVSMQCAVCDHTNVMLRATADTITAATKDGGAPIHCSCCGSEMFAISAEMEDGANNGSQELKTPDDPPPIKADADEMPKDMDGDGDIDEDDIALQDLEAASGDEDCEASSSGDQMKTPDAPVIEADDMVVEPFTLEEDVSMDVDLDSPVMTEELVEDDDFGVPDIDGDPLVDALDLDDTEMALAFVRANGLVLAMKGPHAIAAFTKQSAGKNYSLANSEALPAAAKASVAHEGLRAGLKAVGFQLLKVPMKSDAVVQRKLQEMQASAKRTETAKAKEFAATFALAAAGLNRGNWRGFENPLAAALENEFTSMGVKSPRRLVARLLQESGMQYAETLLQVSNRLAGMSASVRKDLAASLEITNDVQASSLVEEDEDEPSVASSITSRFASPARLTASVEKSSPRAVTAAAEILAGKAQIKFASL